MLCLLLFIVSCVTSLRVTRSATDCPEVVVSNFSSPRLQVFLTVNSRARVHWDGTFEKRKIELNWVNPTDRHDGDTVGLFKNDPQWFGTANPLIQVNIERKIENRNFVQSYRRAILASTFSPPSSFRTSRRFTTWCWTIR